MEIHNPKIRFVIICFSIEKILSYSLINKIILGQIKSTIEPEQICEGMHKNFSKIIHHIRELSFEEEPSYHVYCKQFKEILEHSNIGIDQIDQAFDWDRNCEKKQHTPKRTESMRRFVFFHFKHYHLFFFFFLQ